MLIEDLKTALKGGKMKIYLVFKGYDCEVDQSCGSYLGNFGELIKAFKNKKEAEKYVKESYGCGITEIELE